MEGGIRGADGAVGLERVRKGVEPLESREMTVEAVVFSNQ